MRNYFNSLPDELLDAASVDGCTDFGALWRIMLPLSLPVQAIVITLVFLSSWNNYLLPLLFLRSQDMYTVPIAAVSYAFDAGALNTVGAIAYDSLFSALFILAAPTVIIFLLLQRVFMGSVTAGALRT
ncbi:MAG: ABC transporter permease subunit [Aggregatilineales bacterium]